MANPAKQVQNLLDSPQSPPIGFWARINSSFGGAVHESKIHFPPGPAKKKVGYLEIPLPSTYFKPGMCLQILERPPAGELRVIHEEMGLNLQAYDLTFQIFLIKTSQSINYRIERLLRPKPVRGVIAKKHLPPPVQRSANSKTLELESKGNVVLTHFMKSLRSERERAALEIFKQHLSREEYSEFLKLRDKWMTIQHRVQDRIRQKRNEEALGNVDL